VRRPGAALLYPRHVIETKAAPGRRTPKLFVSASSSLWIEE
jgi:hypothetical protein